MSVPWPKILTQVTVPTDGWAFKSDISVAGQYDTAVDVIVPAGSYYISGDNQDDDLLFVLQTVIQAELTAIEADRYVCVWIDPDSHKVQIMFAGTNFTGATKQDVQIDWPDCTDDLAAALGFDISAIDAKTTENEPLFGADWQHAWGWYADEDGLLADLPVEDKSAVQMPSARALDGGIVMQHLGEWRDNRLALQFLSRVKALSGGRAYGETAVYPYERNQGLECWWRAAMFGVPFRVYADARINTDLAVFYKVDSFYVGPPAGTYVFDSSVLDTDPQRCAGGIIWATLPLNDLHSGRTDSRQAFYVESNTASTVLFSNAPTVGEFIDPQPFYYFDHRYQTYVIAEDYRAFDYMELPGLDRYNVRIGLSRYVA